MRRPGFNRRGAPARIEGLVNAETEATLREAMAAPEAPGEEESYRRLMAVIAEDMRLRQPAPTARGPWGWVPAFSAACTVAILLAAAYVAGVDKGQKIAAQRDAPSAPVTRHEPVIPRPPAPSAETPPDSLAAAPEPPAPPPLSIREIPGSPMNYMGSLLSEGLSREQREMLRLYQEQARARHWDAAAATLEDLADLDPASDAALNALWGAAGIWRDMLKDDREAARVYRREEDLLRQRIEAAPPERRAALEERLQHTRSVIATLETAPPER